MSLALLASLVLSAKPPVYDKPLPPPPPLPVEVSQAYPGCFLEGSDGQYVNLDSICHAAPSRTASSAPSSAIQENQYQINLPTTAYNGKWDNDDIYAITHDDLYCEAIGVGRTRDEAGKIVMDEVVRRILVLGNPNQSPLFSDNIYQRINLKCD